MGSLITNKNSAKHRHRLGVFALGLCCFLLNGLHAGENPVDGVAVSEVRIEGATVLGDAELTAIAAEYSGRTLYIEDLVDLANNITEHYVEAGFITSGAYLPDQDISDGVLTVNVVEGELSDILIESNGRYSPNYLRKLIRSEISQPFNIEDLQRALLYLERDTRIQSVKGRVRPTADRGRALLDLSVVENNPLSFVLSSNNYLSPSIGSEQLQLSVRHLNVLGIADEFYLNLSKSDGFEALGISYSLPLQSLGIVLGAYYSSGDTIVIEEPFDQIDIRSETDTQGISVRKDFRIFNSSSFSLQLGIEKKQSEASLLGEGFDFSLGSIDGEARASIAYAGLEFRQESRDTAWALSSSWRHGMNIWSATEITGKPDGQFDSLVTQLEVLRRLPGGSILSLRINSQLTADSLQSFERLPLGGYQSVRGYRHNQLLKDNGWDAMLDYEIPVLEQLQDRGYTLALIPHVGLARGWDSKRFPNIDRAASLSSAGISLTISSDRNWSARLDWAHRFENKRKQGNQLQDDGIYLSLSYGF